MKNLILFLLFLFSSAMATAFIFGGQEARKSDIKGQGLGHSVVGLIAQFEGPTAATTVTEKCTGSLIARNIVLTAGHCVITNIGGKMKDLRVYFEHLQINGMAQNVLRGGTSPRRIVVHPDYLKNSNDHKNDIALLLLNSDAPEDIPLMTLPKDRPNLQSLSSFIYGYGMSDDRPNPRDSGIGILRWMSVGAGALDLVSPEQDRFLSDDQGLFAEMIKFDATSSGVCHSDSGGPLFVKDASTGELVQIGITESVIADMSGQELYDSNTLGINDFQKKYPEIHLCRGQQFFVNVFYQSAWIQSTLAALRGGR